MAKHMKQGKKAWGLKIGGIVAACVSAAVLLCVLMSYGGVLDAISTLFNTSNPSIDTGTTMTTTTTEPAPAPPITPVYQKPEQMKGVWLTPEVDYYLSSKNTGEVVKEQIDKAFSSIDTWSFNTILLPLSIKDSDIAVYPSEVVDHLQLTLKDGQAFDPVSYILTLARERKLFVYPVINLHVQDGEEWDPRKPEGLARTKAMIHEVVSRYAVDGYFLSGFTFSGKQVPEDKRGTAIDALNSLIKESVKMIFDCNPNLYTGLLSNGVWAHKSVDERGSQTAEFYEEFTDGCADTLSWLQQGLFQCLMVQNYSSTSHPTASFQNVIKWWDGVAAAQNIPLYISHSANSIGSTRSGWKATDQLAQQYLYCKATASWKGSCYDSLSALNSDKTGAKEALQRAYEGTLDEKYIYKQLTLTFPPKTNYTTTSSNVTLQGGGDKNFPLFLNGKELALTEHGFFTLNTTLKVGVNKFEFSHKGTKKLYTITFKQTLIESVSPSTNMSVDGGNPFVISVVARKGSTVTATLNNTTITLKPTELKEDESGNAPSDFQEFKGSYTLPKGTVGQAKALGAVSVKASYNGLSESKTGGKITVKALPVPTTVPNTSVPAGTVIPSPAGDAKIITISSNYAESFSGGTAIDDHSRPYNSYLPKGTKDYWVRTVYNGSLSYYLLASGKRVYCKDATMVTGGTLTATPLQNGSVAVSSTHTTFSFDDSVYIPVYAYTSGQKYYKDDKTGQGTPNYGLERYQQTTTHINLEFHYLSEVPALPDISQSPLFSSAKWIAGPTSQSFTLQLTLKKTGAFYGVSTKWEGNRLTISFLNPANVSKNSAAEKLKGVRILLDPGHGASNDKPWEAPFNLDYANTLKSKLEALGATVDMTRTAPLTGSLSLQQRVIMSQRVGYHMVISVHMNGANGKATGATVHYYTECAYTPSAAVYKEMHEVEVTYGVGTKQNGTPRSSGTVWGTLYMTRSIFHCPSILLECAFLDNAKDKEALIDPIYRDKLMQAVTDGLVNYFSAM